MSLMSIDKILTGKYTGVPVFILTMTLVFYLTFNMPGRLLSDMLSVIIDSSVNTLACCLQNAGTSPALQDLIIDGICAGVGSVLSFIPVIAVLFFFLSILEESGYLPKVAVLLDRPMKKIGLSGKCVVPLVMSFGCSSRGAHGRLHAFRQRTHHRDIHAAVHVLQREASRLRHVHEHILSRTQSCCHERHIHHRNNHRCPVRSFIKARGFRRKSSAAQLYNPCIIPRIIQKAGYARGLHLGVYERHELRQESLHGHIHGFRRHMVSPLL